MIVRRIWLLLLLSITLVTLRLAAPAMSQSEPPVVLVINMEGPLTPAMIEYLERSIRIAVQRDAELLVFRLNTPGGRIDFMQSMVETIRASSIPVVIYIAPRGALAGSAGTMITLAGHAAAMAPETAIGAASPVGAQGEDLGETIAAKEKNILKATARSLAERRGEQAVDLAERAIEFADAASASEALQAGMVDFIANDLDDLLAKLDGFQVEVLGADRVINTTNASVSEIPYTFIEQLLIVLTDSNIVLVLITIGVQAILIEISSPGGWVAGFIGVVCLALATYGLGILPVNWFGIVFLLLSFALFVLDIKAPTHGALTAAGVGSLIVGALVLFNSPGVPAYQRVSVPLVVGMSLLTGATFFTIMIIALRAQRAPHRTGQESLLGRSGVVRTRLAPVGTVQLAGELWTAQLDEGEEPLEIGRRVRVTHVEGVRIFVRSL